MALTLLLWEVKGEGIIIKTQERELGYGHKNKNKP